MFTLIKGGTLYGPAKMGGKDVLIVGRSIARIAERIDVPGDFQAQIVSASGKIVTPGLIDLHVHLLGGGGEGGPRTRTPEITLSQITRAGVTTVVGCLGTDDVSRRPETLLTKAMQLEAEGISTYIYCGSYQFPPPTVTGSVRKDLALIPKIIGVGEIAISDHRSSQPSFEELCRLAAEARVGGMLGGKAGLVHLHIGSGRQMLEPIMRIVEETEIPIGQFLPTHLSRTQALLEHALGFARMGGNIDITVKGQELQFPLETADALRMALEGGVAVEQITLSSDANGSMPVFDEKGRIIKLAVGDIRYLFSEVIGLVEAGFPLVDVLKTVTSNPAQRAGLYDTKGSIAEGKDADLLILNPDFTIDTVIAKGRLMVHGGKIVVKGTFEG
ncbi:MAG: beta-aspartyl-peptidase [Desulfobacterales bacterium]|nr:MAG: beta-aspartyl-peptidase [Desulfobacterales bacterium]